MATWIIVKREDLSVQTSYEADQKDDSTANRSWLHAEPVCMHLEMAPELDKDCLEVVLVAEKWTKEGEDDVSVDPEDFTWTHVPEHHEIQADQDKVDAKVQAGREAKLSLMRSQRDAKMLEVDVMVNELALAERADTAAVAAYRTALKNITDDYKDQDGATSAMDALASDLSDLTWPTKP